VASFPLAVCLILPGKAERPHGLVDLVDNLSRGGGGMAEIPGRSSQGKPSRASRDSSAELRSQSGGKRGYHGVFPNGASDTATSPLSIGGSGVPSGRVESGIGLCRVIGFVCVIVAFVLSEPSGCGYPGSRSD
jgi:hypothetical protein